MTARRPMVLDPDELEELLAEVPIPGDCAVALEGSIAEGFGNPGSDVDFLLVSPGDGHPPLMPTVLFARGRRIEVRTRSVRQLEQQFDRVRSAAESGATQELPEDLLNRCQRVLGAVPLRRTELFDQVRARMPARRFAGIVADWFAARGRQALRYACAMDLLGQRAEAGAWMRTGMVHSAKSWAARHGETYLEPKWLPAQLDRLGAEAARRYWALHDAGAADLDRALELAGRFGVGGCATTTDGILVRRVDDVTTWPVGDCVHVIRDRGEVFVLDDAAGKLWRAIVFGRPLADLLAAGGHGGAERIACFVRFGLIGLSWHDGEPLAPAEPLCPPLRPITPPPSAAGPILALGGATLPGRVPVALVPLPARRFCGAALDLVWSNVLIENAREDLVGALAAGQSRVAELTARRMLQVACRGLFSAAGIHPLPPDSVLARTLSELPGPGADLGAQAQSLDRLIGEAPDQALPALDRFVALVRARTGAGEFPSSFRSARGWQHTLEIGHDWLRMGGYLDADLPIDDARDLLSRAVPPRDPPGDALAS